MIQSVFFGLLFFVYFFGAVAGGVVVSNLHLDTWDCLWKDTQYPIGYMYGIFTDIRLIFMVNVAKYTIHGYYGYRQFSLSQLIKFIRSP